MRLRYTRTAARELADVLASIAAESPQGARRVHLRLREAIDLLAEFPLIGQSTLRPGLRRLVVLPYPYVVFYQVRETEVVIVGVRHGSQVGC